MEDFETLYNDTILSLQDNEIGDMFLLGVLRTPDFVALLKSLYECADNEDKTDIYSACLLQGFRVCDLQKALCLLKGEFYDSTYNFYPVIEKKSESQDSVIENEQLDEIEKKEPEEYYFSIKLFSEEDVGSGQRNWIRLQSNLFSVVSILDEALQFFECSVDEANIVTIDRDFETPCCGYPIDKKVDINKVELVAVQNEVSFYCNDIEKLGYLYYLIRNYTENLTSLVMFENCLVKMRMYIESINTFLQDVLLEKIITNKNILSICNDSNIYRVRDFLDKKPSNLPVNGLDEAFTQIRQMDTSMPKTVFDAWVDRLLPREHYVISKRYLEGELMTLESIGLICNVSRERIRQVERKAIQSMLSPKRIKYRSLLINQLKLLSPHKSYITISELENLNIKTNAAIFLDKIMGDIIFDNEFQACFFSRNSKYNLEQSLEELPDEFTKSDLTEYCALIAEETKGAFLPQEIYELISRKYKIYGEYIAKNRITIKVVLSYLMQKYFPEGMDIYEDENIQFLREKAIEEFYGFELADNNRAVRARLQDFCVLVDRGVWKYDTDQVIISNALQKQIIEYIDEYKSPVLPIQAILDRFVEEFKAIGIYNKYSLHGQLKKVLTSDYSINRDYVFKSGGNSFYEVVEAYVKQSTMPVTKRDIQNNFPGITDIVIQQVAAATKVINMNGYYVHLDNLNISDEETNTLKELVDSELSDMEIHHSNVVFSKIKSALSGLFGRIGVTHYLQFYYLLREIYPNDYEYNRPFIGALGVEVISGEAQVINIILKQDECSIAMIRQYAREVGTIIDRYIEFIDRNNDSFIFKNRDSIISTSAAGIDDVDWTGLDAILSDYMQGEQYKLLSDFYNFRELPDLRCTWNTWLLYSIVRKYSQEFKLTLTSHFLNEAKPILVRRDYDEQNIDLEAIAKMDTGDTEQFSDSDDEMLDDFDYDDLE